MYDNYTSLNKIIVVGIHKKKKILQSVQSDESDIF
jgi:hypothetical protein